MASLELLLNSRCLIVPQLSMYECLKYYELPALMLVLGVVAASVLIRFLKYRRISNIR